METLEAVFVVLSILIMTTSIAVISTAGKREEITGKLFLSSLLFSTVVVLIIYFSPVLTLTLLLVILIVTAFKESNKRNPNNEHLKM